MGWREPVGFQYLDGQFPVFQQDRAVDRRIFQRQRYGQVTFHQHSRRAPVVPVIPLYLSRLHDRRLERHEPVEHGRRHEQAVADRKAILRNQTFQLVVGLIEIVVVLKDQFDAVPWRIGSSIHLLAPVGIHDDGLVPELTKCKILKREDDLPAGVIQPLLHGLREISRQDVVVLDEPDVVIVPVDAVLVEMPHDAVLAVALFLQVGPEYEEIVLDEDIVGQTVVPHLLRVPVVHLHEGEIARVPRTVDGIVAVIEVLKKGNENLPPGHVLLLLISCLSLPSGRSPPRLRRLFSRKNGNRPEVSSTMPLPIL